VQSGSDGQFAFTGLPPDLFKLTISAPGMSTFPSTQIDLHTGEFGIVPPVKLSVSPVTTSVTVSGNKKELSEEQVHIAEQQRIAKVLPNFYSTYDWNAPPMEAKHKSQLSIRSIIDPVSFLTVAGSMLRHFEFALHKRFIDDHLRGDIESVHSSARLLPASASPTAGRLICR
jgi:hypothetical protein